MRVPISYALHHPERVDVPVKPLDLAAVGALTFEPVDDDAFPCLRLARDAAAAGGTAPCVLNAANEIAVHAFLQGRLDFLGIPAVIEETLERTPPQPRARLRVALRGRPRGARARRRARRRRPEPRVSYFLAFAGFAALIILHEFGHFAAAKAVGMRVERFSLFFPPLLAQVPPRRDGVRDRGRAARRLREDHRDEPERAHPAGDRASGLLRASRSGSASS